MFMELALSLSLKEDLAKSINTEIRRELPKVCESKFEAPEKFDQEYEMMFRLLLEEVQRQHRN